MVEGATEAVCDVDIGVGPGGGVFVEARYQSS